MLDKIVPQVELEVKCEVEGCHEPTFRKGEFCFGHFIAEAEAAWDEWDTERRMVEETIGYLWGDPLEVTA